MNVKNVEKLEHSMVRVTIEIEANEFDAAVESVYRRMKNQLNVPGFRKGKAPRKLVEKMYGANLFYEDAVNDICPKAVEDAVDQENLEIVGYPEMHVESVGPEGVIVNADIAVRPEVTVENYKGIVAPYKDAEVTEHDVDVALTPYINRAKTTVEVDREAAEGDTVVIDFVGYKNGKEFKGGKAEGYELKLGSHSFIPGFEEQLIGAKAGDEKELNLTFPADYAQKELAGAPVVFKVKVNTVKTIQEPVLDDEFAKDVSEFDTLADLKKDVKEKLQQEADKKAQVDMENSLITTVIENMEGDIPQCMYDNKINEMVNDFSYRLQSQGMSLDLYLHYTGSDMKSFRETFQESAERQVKIRLALEKIAEVENLTATPEEIDAEYEKIAKNYGIDVSRVKGVLPEKEVIKDVTVNKAIDLVKDSAEVTEKKVKKTASKSKKKAEEAPAENAEEASADEE